MPLSNEFWIASTNCNPSVTIQHGASQKLQLFAQHFTLDDPLGKAVDDVTSWVDWGKVETSGCGITVSTDGVLETANSVTGDFGISFSSAVNTPNDSVFDSRLDPIVGVVTESKNSTVNSKELKLKVKAKKCSKRVVVKTDKKASVKIVVAGKRYTFSSSKNKTGKVTVKLSKKLSKGQSVKVTASKDGFIDKHVILKIK